MEYKEQTFDIPELEGISTESVKQHIGLYEGYVKNFNAMTKLMDEFFKDSEKNAHALAELVRRRSFEFGGMRLHENYFTQWEGGSAALATGGSLAKALASQFGSQDEAVSQIKTIGMMRGPGWSLLYYDPTVGEFRVGFTGEQHMGHFVTLPIILALDVWEHAYILDHGAAGKGKYVDAFFKNLNWGVMEKRFEALQT
ncbi:MAG: Fe-Mn family superoxide dismutase [Patescibacteria group bacterium]|nr:Fe-Mn family superoxide dismutase [Patescibacteria group bacterium]